MVQGKALKPFLPQGMTERAQAVPFRLPNGTRALGYSANDYPTYVRRSPLPARLRRFRETSGTSLTRRRFSCVG